MNVNIRVPGGSFGSLPYVGKLTAEILSERGFNVTISNEYRDDSVNVLIDETISSVMEYRKAEIWWTDSPGMLFPSYFDSSKALENDLFVYHYVTSEFMKEHCSELSIPVDGVIYRPIYPKLFDYFNPEPNKKYDVMTIGKKCICDRKNIAIQRNVVTKLKLKYCAITDAWLPNRPYITKYEFGTVDDETKSKLLSESKFLLWTSFIEGFGMPVLEAMATGCVPIYTDCPAHNEFAEGIPIPVGKRGYGFCYSVKVFKYPVIQKEVEKTVRNAIEISDEEYVELSHKCYEKAKSTYDNTIKDIDNVLIKSIEKVSCPVLKLKNSQSDLNTRMAFTIDHEQRNKVR